MIGPNENLSKRPWEQVLTPRDVALIEFIATHGYISGNYIGEMFWGNLKSRIHNRRIRFLEKMGVIERLMGESGYVTGYRLTKKCLTWLNEKHNEQQFFYRSAIRSSANHDQTALQVEKIFTQSSVVSSFVPEHQLRVLLTKKYGNDEKRDRGFKVPDAFFKLRTLDGLLNGALELELSHKSEKRYLKILRQLSISEDFTVVFYVCANARLIQKIERVLKKLRTSDFLVMGWKVPHGFYFCELPDLFANGLNTKFQGEGIEFSLNSMAQKLEMINNENAS